MGIAKSMMDTDDIQYQDYPYRQLFRLLSDMNFKGYCNAEIPGNDDPVRLLRYYRGLFLALQDAL